MGGGKESEAAHGSIGGEPREPAPGRRQARHVPTLRAHTTEQRAPAVAQNEVHVLAVPGPDRRLHAVPRFTGVADDEVAGSAAELRGEVCRLAPCDRDRPDMGVHPSRGPLLAEAPEEGDGLAVGRERGRSIGSETLREPRHRTAVGRDRADVQVVVVEVRVLEPVRCERDLLAVRREHRLRVIEFALGELPRNAARNIDHMKMLVRIEEEAHAVLFEVRRREDLVGVPLGQLAFLLRLAACLLLVADRPEGDHQTLPVRRPRHRADGAVQVGEPLGLAAVQRKQINLLALLVPVRDERERAAVRRPAGHDVARIPEGEAPRLAPVKWDQIKACDVLVLRQPRFLDGIGDVLAVRRNPRVADEGDFEQRFRGDRFFAAVAGHFRTSSRMT